MPVNNILNLGISLVRTGVLAACVLSAVFALPGCTPKAPAVSSPESIRDQVWAAEVAFAKTMAVRDLQAFGTFVADEALFFSGTSVLRGKAKVIEGWAEFFKDPAAPFSWEPDQVEVLESGSLALSTGPVRDPTGKIIARFNSIWRLESSGYWRIVIDKGGPPSPGPTAEQVR